MRLSELIETAGVAVRRMVGDGGENIERVVCDSREAAPETRGSRPHRRARQRRVRHR